MGADGGLHIPHSTKRFPGYKAGDEKGQGEYDAEFHKERIFGGHVSEYMESMKDEDEQQYKKMYSGYINAEIEPDAWRRCTRRRTRRSARVPPRRRRCRI